MLLLTCVVNCAAGTPTPRLCPVVQWSVHWAPSRTTRVLLLAGARRCVLETCGKKNRASLNLYIKSDSRFAVVQLLITSSTSDWIEHHSVPLPLLIIKDRFRAREKCMHVNIHNRKFTCNRVQLPQQQQTENDHFYHPRHDQVCVCIHNNSWVEYLACHQCKMSNQRGNPCDAVRWR